MKLVLLLAILISPWSTAHEGHDTPGSLPPAPHGGTVQEAAESQGHKHSGSSESSSFFFEASYRENTLRIYPLSLSQKDPTLFESIPKEQISNLTVTIEISRQKKVSKVSMIAKEGGFEGAFNAGRAHRFLVRVGGVYKGESKEATIQLEQK